MLDWQFQPSANMLADSGAGFVIVGHSERRIGHGESSSQVGEKALAASAAGLTAIVCVGETEAERNRGEAYAVVLSQLDLSAPEGVDPRSLIVAYEPVWAIGTGRTAAVSDVRTMHTLLRSNLVARFGDHGGRIRVLYGGSVKPGNAAELMSVENVDGALVGGASLSANDFHAIILAASERI